MLRKVFTQVFFRNNSLVKRSRLGFAASKEQPNQQQQLNKQYKKSYADNDDDEAQPQYEKEDRTTTGWLIYRFFFWGSFSLLSYNLYLVSHHEQQTPVQNQTGAIPGFIGAAKFIYGQYNEATEFLTKPPVNKLLPDVIHPLIHPKTLVLNVSGTLLDHDFIFGKGVNIKKRPGLSNFLKKMSQIYEVVIFSDDEAMFIESIIPTLDPRQQIISGFYGRQCMVLSKGRYIKDLKYLNRDLKNVVVIDKNLKTVSKHQQNVILLPEFHGEQNDNELIKLTFLLQQLSKPEVRDVRKAISKLGENPLEKYSNIIKQKQEKIKGNKSNILFEKLGKKN